MNIMLSAKFYNSFINCQILKDSSFAILSILFHELTSVVKMAGFQNDRNTHNQLGSQKTMIFDDSQSWIKADTVELKLDFNRKCAI